MFSLLDLRFMLCSRDLDEVRTHRITFYVHCPQIDEVRSSDDVEVNATGASWEFMESNFSNTIQLLH